MQALTIKHSGRVSTIFTIICTILACVAVVCVYQFSVSNTNKNRVEQAEFEQTYGKPAGSSTNYKELQKAIDTARENEIAEQNSLKQEWLTRFDTVLKSHDYSLLEQTVIDLKTASIGQAYRVQVFDEVVTNSVNSHDAQALSIIVTAGKPSVSCQINGRLGRQLLTAALEEEELTSFETLAEGGCVNANNELISYITTAPEPKPHRI